MHMPSRLILIHLKVLNLLIGLLELFFLLSEDLINVPIHRLTLLNLIFFGEDHGRDALVDLAEQSVKWVVIRIYFGDFLERMQIG